VARETAHLYERVRDHIPEIEWPVYAPYVHAINRIKKERGAAILAHNYQTPEIFHCVADIVGDSLQLAREATLVDEQIIIQCGVHFMAETSKLLNPDKTVLIPMEGRVFAVGIDHRRRCAAAQGALSGVPVVTYVNTSADVKAETDICCTSSNAVACAKASSPTRCCAFPTSIWR
jgi:quinolinate synthase